MKSKLLLTAFLFFFILSSFATDTTPPTITLKYGQHQNVQLGSVFILSEPLSVSDNVTDSADIVVTTTWGYNGAVNSMVRKVYPLYIVAEDLAGNKAYDTVWFNTDDTIPPVINLNTPDEVCVKYQTPYNSVQPTVTDNFYSSGQISLVKKSSDVNTNVIGTYTEVFEAVDGSGNITTKTRIVHVKYDCNTVGIQQQKLNTVSIYPNPGNGHISIIGLENQDEAFVSVYNANGALVYNSSMTDSIDLSGLSMGLYFIQITQNKEIITLTYNYGF